MQIWVHIKLKCKFLACKEACQESFKKGCRDKEKLWVTIVGTCESIVNVKIELKEDIKNIEFKFILFN